LADWRNVQEGEWKAKVIIHVDPAQPHIAGETEQILEQKAIKKVPHPAYLSDLVLLDFCRFGHVKELLTGRKFPYEGHFLKW
jgi:hypothetical protein